MPAGSSPLPVLASASVPFTFLLTPPGLLSAYLVLSGLLRVAMAVADAPGGDPLLTLADHFLRERRLRVEQERALARRAALEGPEVPDLLLSGSEAGFPDAEWVVVASRLKPGWEAGAFVVTADRWYKLGPRQDRQQPDGLRAFYPLGPVAATEVIRRAVPYDHPRLSASEASQPFRDG
jgi:hypothetical protein